MPTHDPETPPEAMTPQRAPEDAPHLTDEQEADEDRILELDEGLHHPVDPPDDDSA